MKCLKITTYKATFKGKAGMISTHNNIGYLLSEEDLLSDKMFIKRCVKGKAVGDSCLLKIERDSDIELQSNITYEQWKELKKRSW
jgi:hypothetical protein